MTPISFAGRLTRQMLVEELEEIERLLDQDRGRIVYTAAQRVRELRLAVERKPIEIDVQ